jgi:hypothetical protein
MSQRPKSAAPSEVVKEAQARPVTETGDGWREEAIRAWVLTSLGRPAELVKVAVLPLWGDHFRVNVWVGAGAGSIPDSYFVTADARGTILDSQPPIQKRY